MTCRAVAQAQTIGGEIGLVRACSLEQQVSATIKFRNIWFRCWLVLYCFMLGSAMGFV